MESQPEAEDDEDEMDDPEAHDGFFFAPAFELKMMMERGHEEDTPAEEISRDDLDDDRDGFDVEHEAEKEKGAGLADGHGVHGEEGAEAEGADVAHHESGRFDVEISISHQSPNGRGIQDGQLAEAVDPGKKGQGAESGEEHAASQAIEPVGDVDGIGGEHDNEDDDWNDPDAGVNGQIKWKIDKMPSRTEFGIDPPGGQSPGDELEDEFLVNEYSSRGSGAKPDGNSLEGCPRQSQGIPDSFFPFFVDADKGENMAHFFGMAFDPENIHEVVNGAQGSGKKHDVYGDPSEAS